MPAPALASINRSLLTTPNMVGFAYDSLEEAFPDVDPGHRPLGNIALFQVRLPKMKSSGGIILIDEARSTEHYNTQVVKVIALGPLCFKNTRPWEDPETGKPVEVLTDYAEGPWFKVGDYVRVPKYSGDRVTRSFDLKEMQRNDEGKMEPVTVKVDVSFVFFRARDIIAVIDKPLEIRAFLD